MNLPDKKEPLAPSVSGSNQDSKNGVVDDLFAKGTSTHTVSGLPPLEDPVEEVEKKPAKKNMEEIKEKPAVKIVEKVIIKEKSKGGGGGLPLPGCGCRSCSCFGCLLIVGFIVLSVSVLLFKPSVLWNPVKTFLNAGQEPPIVASVPPGGTKTQVELEIKSSVRTEVTEAQMQALVSEKLDSNNVRVDIEPNFLRIYTNIDEEEKPLWVIFEIGQNDTKELVVTKVGFGRFGLPDSFKDFLTDNAFEALSITGAKGDDDGIKLVGELLDSSGDELGIKSVRFDKDKITISSDQPPTSI